MDGEGHGVEVGLLRARVEGGRVVEVIRARTADKGLRFFAVWWFRWKVSGGLLVRGCKRSWGGKRDAQRLASVPAWRSSRSSTFVSIASDSVDIAGFSEKTMPAAAPGSVESRRQ